MSPRIYTEIRIAHKTEEEKSEFKRRLIQQASKLGLTYNEYISLIVNLDASTGLIERLNSEK